MVCLPQNNMDDEIEEVFDNSDYIVRRKGGRSLIDKTPKFSSDGSCLFVISGRGVQVYDVGTGEFVRSLKCKENLAPIVGLSLVPDDDRTLISCAENGYIVNWKWHAGVKTSNMVLNCPKEARILSFDLISPDRALIGYILNNEPHMAVVGFAEDDKLNEVNVSKFGKTVGPSWSVAVGFFEDRTLAAVTQGTYLVCVFDVNHLSNIRWHMVSHNVVATQLAWHPSQEILAVGDTLGRVALWQRPLDGARCAREMKHWHHLPLAALAYSVQGGNLLSGGGERVMVVWGYGDNRKFVPRMPAEILHIASSPMHIAISTADNAIQIVDAASLYVTGCIREAGGLGGARRVIRLDGQENMFPGAGLQYCHPSRALVLPAGPGHLHMYSTITDSLLYTLDVTNTNIVPPERHNLHPEQIEILQMSVGCRGEWLCTWEGRGEQERMRWFSLSSSGSERGWSLHTAMARPHRPSLPAALHVSTDSPITVSYDDTNRLRFWSLVDNLPGYEGKAAWCTSGTGVCGGGEAGGVCLSGDGSVCAVWAGSRLALWDTHKGQQRACLSHPALRPRGRLVQFGRDHHMHYLACTTDTTLAVWNTLSLRLVWLVQLSTTCLVADPFSDRVAAVTTDNDVYIFRLSMSFPLVSLPAALPPSRGAITSVGFAPCPISFRLYLLREQQEIFVIEHVELETKTLHQLERMPSNLRPAPSAYSAMVAEKTLSMVQKLEKESSVNMTSTRQAITQLLLSAPSHAQPSLSLLCKPFLKLVVGSKKPSFEMQETKTSQEQEDQDVKMDQGSIRRNKFIKPVSLKSLEKEDSEWTKNVYRVKHKKMTNKS